MMNTRILVGLGALAALALGDAAALRADPAHDHPGDADATYVYFRDDGATTMSGGPADVDRARRFKRAGEPMLWFRDGGQDYVIRDPATLKQVDAIWKPVQDIGEAQGKLGSQQGELGRQQGELGSQQALLGTRQGALSVREASLSMRASSDSLSDAGRAEIARQRHELRQQMRALTRQMRALQRPMKELGERMAALGRDMEALGQRMTAAVHKASGELRALEKRAIASGIASPAK